MGTPHKKSGSLRSKLFQSLSSKSGLKVLYTSRTRGNSDNLLSNSSTLNTALSGSMRKDGMNDDSDSEEYKSEDNRLIVLTDSSEESCQSEPGDDD